MKTSKHPLRRLAPDLLAIGERCQAPPGMILHPGQNTVEAFDGKKWRIVNKTHRVLERVA